MSPIEGELADRVRADYLAQNATRETSRAIIDGIAQREGITVAKVRHILTYGGPGYVRWTKEDQVWSDKDGAIRDAFANFNSKSNSSGFLSERRKFLADISNKLFFTQKALTGFAQKEGFWPWHGSEKSEFDQSTKTKEAQESARIEQNRVYRELIETRKSPPLVEHVTYRNKTSPIGYIVVGVLAVFAIFILMQNVGSGSQSTRSDGIAQSPPSSDTSSGFVGGPASDSERKAYSVDTHDTPSGLTPEMKERYDRLPPEGREAFDRKMNDYDKVCAQTSDC